MKGEIEMFLDVSSNRYQTLIRTYFNDEPNLAEQIFKLAPTAAEFRQLSTREITYLKNLSTERMGRFLDAVQIGEFIVKSPHDLYGHAYSSTLVGQALLEEYAGDQQESVTILCTDVHNEIIAKQRLFIGGQSQCSLFPDQIFRYAIKNCATGVIVVHNHPSGSIEPSDNDLQMCRRIDQAGNTIGIHLLDFLIVGSESYYSWREDTLDL